MSKHFYKSTCTHIAHTKSSVCSPLTILYVTKTSTHSLYGVSKWRAKKKIVERMDVRCAWSRTRSKWPKWVNNATPSNRNTHYCVAVSWTATKKQTDTHTRKSRRWKLNQSSHGQKVWKNTHVTSGKKGPNKPYHALCVPVHWPDWLFEPNQLKCCTMAGVHCAPAPAETATFWIPNWWTGTHMWLVFVDDVIFVAVCLLTFNTQQYQKKISKHAHMHMHKHTRTHTSKSDVISLADAWYEY